MFPNFSSAVVLICLTVPASTTAQRIAESLHAPPSPLTEAARKLTRVPAANAEKTSDAVRSPAIDRDAESERNAIWNSPEMRDAQQWVIERFRASGRYDTVRARYYLEELSRLDAPSMHRWLADVARMRQQALHRQIASEAAWRFERVRSSMAQRQRSQYDSQASLMQEARSRSAERSVAAFRLSGPPAADAGRRSGQDVLSLVGDSCAR